MDPMESIKQTYFQECEELLYAMEEGLIAMENGEADDEIINAVFRAVHSIKGGGGAFGFDSMVSFAHVFETVLDKIRSAELSPDHEVVKVLLRAGTCFLLTPGTFKFCNKFVKLLPFLFLSF